MDPTRRRVTTLVALACALGTLLGLGVTSPAQASGLNLHLGSRGTVVKTLETRLARLALLPRSAVDRRYRTSTVRAVKRFQRARHLRVTGTVNRTTWNLIGSAYARAVAPPPPWQPPSWAAPGVAAHRGGISPTSPENTMASMQYAVSSGAEVAEFDLRMTSDDVPVLMHDNSLKRTTNCDAYTVSASTLANLRAYCHIDGGYTIPTFEEVASYLATTGIAIAPEIKQVNIPDPDLQTIVGIIREHGLEGRTFVQSFDHAVFPRLTALEPQLRPVYLSDTVAYASTVKTSGAAIAAVKLSNLAAANVGVYHSSGVQVWTYTADTQDELRKAWSIGVDVVVTDTPVAARSLYR